VVLKIEAVGMRPDMHAGTGTTAAQPGLILGRHPIAQSAARGLRGRHALDRQPAHHRHRVLRAGRNNLCAHRTMVGMTRPGAYAEYMSIPAASLIAMPQDMPALAAALTEPAATAWHAINLSMRVLTRPLHECRVLVIGGGAIGMLAALLLRHLGVDRLTVTELNPLRRETLARVARCEAIDPRSTAPRATTTRDGAVAASSRASRPLPASSPAA
jgi:alcohol dehydrogenase